MATAQATPAMDAPAQKPKDVLKGHYLGHLPEKPGNFYCFDLMTREEYLVKVFEGPESRLQALSGKDHQVHDLSEFDVPNIRWISVEPLGRDGIDKYLGTFA